MGVACTSRSRTRATAPDLIASSRAKTHSRELATPAARKTSRYSRTIRADLLGPVRVGVGLRLVRLLQLGPEVLEDRCQLLDGERSCAQDPRLLPGAVEDRRGGGARARAAV